MTQQIIVCDDEPHIVRAISLKFTRSGCDVKGATDIESCWRMLHRNEPPALLIIDDSLPAWANVSELLRRIRNDAVLADLPVVVLTSKDSPSISQSESLTRLRISQFVAKPFNPRELLAIVDGLLGTTSDVRAPFYGSTRHAMIG